MEVKGPEISKSALIIVDMQNDFVHPDGHMGRRSREQPERRIDMPFLSSPVNNVRLLADAFRKAGRPVVYITHVMKPDFSDAAIPYWRNPRPEDARHVVEGSWGAQVVDELKPLPWDHVVIKKGFGGFANTPLDTILRNLGVTTCVVCGVTTAICVSTTIRGGVEHNYRMIVVSDATAEIRREEHEVELRILARNFADPKTTEEVIAMLSDIPQEK